MVLIPCTFAKYSPIIAVRKTKATVFRAPTLPPIFIIKKISSVGRAIKSKKNHDDDIVEVEVVDKKDEL